MHQSSGFVQPKQGIFPLKYFPKEHLKWFQQMAKRSAVNDGLLMYGDKLMEDQNHYRITVPNDITLQCHLSRGPIMIRP